MRDLSSETRVLRVCMELHQSDKNMNSTHKPWFFAGRNPKPADPDIRKFVDERPSLWRPRSQKMMPFPGVVQEMRELGLFGGTIQGDGIGLNTYENVK